MSVRTIVKSIQDIRRQDVGVDGDAQRLSQLCWMFFLKIIDDQDKELEVMRDGYRSPVPARLQWRTWAADPEGMTGEDLLGFEKGERPQEGWFYEHRVPEGQKAYSTTEAIRVEHLQGCADWWGGAERQGHQQTEQASRVGIDEIKARTLTKLYQEMDRSKEEFIKHHRNNLGMDWPPVWILIEVASFGNISSLLGQTVPPRIRQAVADTYDLDEKVFCSLFHHLSVVRNTAAHHSRRCARRSRGGCAERQGLAQTDLVGRQPTDLAVVFVMAEALRDESLLPRLGRHALAVHGRLDQRRGGQRLLGLDRALVPAPWHARLAELGQPQVLRAEVHVANDAHIGDRLQPFVSDLEQGAGEIAGDAPVAARTLELLGQKGLVEAMFAQGNAANGHGPSAAWLMAAAFSSAAG